MPNVNDIEYLVLISVHSNAYCDTARSVAHNTVCPHQKMLHATFPAKENDEDVHMVKENFHSSNKLTFNCWKWCPNSKA